MSIAILQLNFTVGAIQSNADIILKEAKKAYAAGARIIITPELALCGGSSALDILLRRDFLLTCEAATKRIAASLAGYPDLYLLLGHPSMSECTEGLLKCYNTASVIHAGKVLQSYAKHQLCDFGAAAESRYFSACNGALVFDVDGVRYGVLISDDVLVSGEHSSFSQTINAGAQVLLVLAAPPYFQGSMFEKSVSKIAQAYQKPIIVAQMVGAQDELVFYGASFAVSGDGIVQARARSFEEDIFYTHVLAPDLKITGVMNQPYASEESLWRA
ncbi:MAG: nitrilase-related carbon-nitrogen hydrolase, partial [Saezia sp.]